VFDAGPCDQPPEPALLAVMLTDHGRCDAVEPRPGVRAAQVIAFPPPEGGEERLRHQVIGQIPAEPPRDVPMHHLVVPVVEKRESLGLTQ
jgi:hypothetical protein